MLCIYAPSRAQQQHKPRHVRSGAEPQLTSPKGATLQVWKYFGYHTTNKAQHFEKCARKIIKGGSKFVSSLEVKIHLIASKLRSHMRRRYRQLVRCDPNINK